jgi:tetratricopeptide (TPR) repeat protein
MPLDLYSPCPCGSGKKFKWCCLNIFEDIERAFAQAGQGQHEAALRIMEGVTKAHSDNPEAWGRKAQLLFLEGRNEEGEKALEKAFELNPNYPLGLLLQAQLRFNEGETTGALILARRAAEAFDPEARDYLTDVYNIIAEAEMGRNRPVAAHAALRMLVRYQPGEQQLRDALEAAFGPNSRLPECARRVYTFLSPAGDLKGERRQAWDEALAKVESPRLGALAAAFEQLTVQDANDAAAWFNLGLVQAWLGDNRKALAALDRYIELEQDEARATQAAALGEVLRCGQGLEDEADYREYAVEFTCRDPQPLSALLQEWHDSERMMVLKTREEGTLAAMLLEPLGATIVTAGPADTRERKIAGYLVLVGDRLRLWGPREEAFNRLRDEVKTRTALAVSEGAVHVGPINFSDTIADAIVMPALETPELAQKRIAEYAGKYFEETWIHKPLRSLSGVPPIDAAGHRTLRKKLLGVIQFLHDCAVLGILKEYDFDRLRHKLGLTTPGAGAGTTAPQATGPDVSAMSAAELAALPVDALSDEQLEKAYQAAQKLDAREVSGAFARALIGRPFVPGRTTDRYPWYAFLAQKALSEGATDEALHYLNEGERVDSEHNEGRRRHDYGLRRGQVHVKRGEADLAHDVFTRLIEGAPDNLKLRGTAAEGMLSLRQPERARRFAEEGLVVARQKNDRDSEQYLMELADAAKRQAAKG